jgi:hypothetical protein
MIRTVIRWVFGIDVLERLERIQAELHQAEVDRDAAWDIVSDLQGEVARLQKFSTMQRSLIRILRDVNRELDERNWQIEGTPQEQTA